MTFFNDPHSKRREINHQGFYALKRGDGNECLAGWALIHHGGTEKTTLFFFVLCDSVSLW
jgi:hypothetical protein